MNRVRVLVSRIIVLVVAAMSLTSTASEERPTRILVGWAAGGATDLVARYMARQLAEVLGQQFVVENFPGAGGNIAADMTAKSPGDGKTLVFLTSAHAINATLYKNLPFEPVEGFQPVAMVGSMTQILVANPKLPYASVKELISAAKANPGGITYASAGSGSSSHLSMEQLAAIAGISLHHVPYKGTSQYLPDLMAGRVDIAIDSTTALAPLVRTGKIRALAVSSSNRFSLFPELPTVAEAGVAGYAVNLWFGFLGPAGMPPAAVNRLNEAVKKIVSVPEHADKLKEMGLAVDGTVGPQRFRQILRDDISRYAKLINASGAKVD